MKKNLSFLLAMIMVLSVFTILFPVSVSAADGGEGRLAIKSPSDKSEVDGTKDVQIKWTKVSGADHYIVVVKDMVTGHKPFESSVNGTSITIPANTVFVVEGRQYKVYVAACDSSGAVLNHASDWESHYVESKISSPQLVYSSPSLTSPAVNVKYDSNAYCYIGTYDGEIDSSKNLTVKWEDVYADWYSFTAVILKDEPDFGSTSEKKLHEIVIQKKRTSCKYTIDKDDLEGFEGQYLKVVVQGMSNTGDYSLMSMFYLKIADPKTIEPDTPPVTDDTNQKSENTTVFLQNQSPWKDHPYGHKDEDCTQSTDLAYSGCGVLSLTNAIYQLNGCFIDPAFIADYAMDNGHRVCGVGTSYSLYSAFASKYSAQYGFKYGTRYTEVDFSTMRKELENGAVIIANTPGHFFVISQFDKNTNTYLVLDSLPSKNRGTTENGDWKTASELSSGSLKVRYYVTLHQTATDSDKEEDVTPPVVEPPIVSSDQVTILIDSATTKPGETVQIPVRIKATGEGISYLRAQIHSGLRYTLVNDSRFSMTEGSTSVIWYANQNVSGTVTLAYIEVTIPTNAPDSACYSITITPVEANNFNEETVSCSGGSSTITVENTLPGDCNGDGEISGKDLTRLLRFLADYNETTGTSSVDIDYSAANLNGDSVIDGKDITRLLKILAD